MKYDITVSKSPPFINCKIKGDMTLQDSIEISSNIDKHSRIHGIHTVLVNLIHAKNISKVIENYDFAYKYLDELNIQKHIVVALLIAKDDKSHNFIETVMRNAGYNAKLFDDKTEAVAWLERHFHF